MFLFLIISELFISIHIDDDLAMIAAQQYFIEYGQEMYVDRLRELLPHYIPDSQLVQNTSVFQNGQISQFRILNTRFQQTIR